MKFNDPVFLQPAPHHAAAQIRAVLNAMEQGCPVMFRAEQGWIQDEHQQALEYLVCPDSDPEGIRIIESIFKASSAVNQ